MPRRKVGARLGGKAKARIYKEGVANGAAESHKPGTGTHPKKKSYGRPI